MDDVFILGGHGIGLRHNAGRDLSVASKLILEITDPKGVTTSREDLTVGSTDVLTRKHGLFKATQYSIYIVKKDEIIMLGRHYLQYEFQFGSGKTLRPPLQILDVES